MNTNENSLELHTASEPNAIPPEAPKPVEASVPVAAPQQPEPVQQAAVPPQQFAPIQQAAIPHQFNSAPQTGIPQQNIPPQQPIYYNQPIQQGGYAAPPLYNQYGQPTYPNYPAPQVSKQESFIGINLLSKIGVVFIIIGVIAFSAVSEEFLSPAIRTAIIFALGVAMTILGEVFYRKSSVIFARALTLGGIGELAVSVLIGYSEYGSLNEWASLLIGVVISAAAILLSLRYKSQTIMTVTVVSGILPCFAAFHDTAPLFASLLYLIALQTAAIIICNKRQWYVAPYVLLLSNLALAIGMNSRLIDLFDDTFAGLITTVYIVLAYLLYIASSVICSFRSDGALRHYDVLSFITANSLLALMSLIFLAIVEATNAFGFLMLFIGLAYFAVAAVAYTTFNHSKLISLLLNTAILFVGFAIPCIFPEGLIYIVFHFYSAALLVIGLMKNTKVIKIWGIVTCSISEYIFLNFCIFNIAEDIYILQFAVNAVLWLIIMTVQAIRKVRGIGVNVFSIAALANTAIFGMYMILRIAFRMDDAAILNGFGEIMAFIMLFGSLVWMIIGFITGKLKFLGKAAPVTAIIFYLISVSGLGITNLCSCISSPADNVICLVASLAVNAVSMAAALDVTLNIRALAPKFSKAVGLVVSLYAMLCVTFTLGANEIMAFTNCIISFMYLALAIVWIIVGFIRKNIILRRFGLALTLLACAKLFLLDFAGVGAVGRTLMFILFGIILLVVSFIYAIFENKLKKQDQEEFLRQQQLQYYNYYNSMNGMNDINNNMNANNNINNSNINNNIHQQ